jgi:CDP-diacylglycerol--glycerol-3-phosphate 3-phosphatidyltransferase
MRSPADSYSALERRLLGPAHIVLRTIYTPIVRVLAWSRIPPNAVSLSQIVFGALVVALMPAQPRLAFVLFVLAIVVDGLDGALARATNRVTEFGAFIDQVADHVREVLVVAGLALFGALNPFLATLYGLAYPGFNLALYLCNRYDTSVPLAIKSYVTFYPALFLFLWFGVNVLDLAAAVSLILMAIVIVQGMWRLRTVMEVGD